MAKEQLEECLRLLKKGNIDAITPIYQQMSKPVYTVAFAILKDEGLAQDVMEDTFLKVRSSINNYQEGTNPSAWILTIARNFALMEYRKRKKEVAFDPQEQDYIMGSYQFEYNEINPALKQALQSLTDEEREIVLLHVIQEYKHREIATMLNKPLGTILWIYNKAMKKLKIALNKEGVNE
ncbi:MAG: RNA polymerase sigma factor [Bacilli bacterium]|nr:RNA polymerase sigma factor [Bacilli bacterium]